MKTVAGKSLKRHLPFLNKLHFTGTHWSWYIVTKSKTYVNSTHTRYKTENNISDGLTLGPLELFCINEPLGGGGHFDPPNDPPPP